MNDVLLRSLMFVPSHNKKLMISASKSNADVLLLDVEDSVQPFANKQVARDTIIKYVKSKTFAGKKIFPRVNDRESGELLKDILQLTIDGIDGFMYPKAKRGEDVYFFDKLLETIEYEKGLSIGTFKIIPLIETASAVMNVQEICLASPRVIAIAYGSEDFITDLEGVHDLEHQSLFTPRAMIAMGARATGVIPIDTVHVRVHDLEDLEKNLKVSKNLGFEGMLVLNPKEIPLVHQYYSPTEQEIKDADAMLIMAEQAKIAGEGVAIINGKFIGPPMIKAAKKILLKQKMIDKKE
ncbi:citrate lyase subunit beta/citryl-CoA lyase [Gelidibacter sediminis]|uniref:Citrate lyase subunit beta/citryl-CoA lyase n=1 Tax=Gelidibacter sediminis TaxID=1608710 RepID=A0A4R7Q5T9_9FLAO|nr:CoA ester lyase [Gelidibacter sediminis]TDU42894.1 citrate lyase subunit beta/citryl-CoA lyase [Gelidibacter sediminis]